MTKEPLLFTVANGRRFVRYAGYMPRPVLKCIFGTAVFRAIRGEKPAVWRPLAEAVLGDALLVRTSPKRIAGIMPFALTFDGEQVETSRWFVLPGDWDLYPLRLEDHETYPRMRDLLSGDLRHSASYKELSAQEIEGKLPARVKKRGGGTVDGYFDYYRSLADKMTEMRAVPNLGANDKDKYIGIALGRDGQIIQQQKGHHRSIIAQFVPCDKMEAKVLAVHPLWVKRLDRNLAFGDAIKDGIARLLLQCNVFGYASTILQPS
jgi:hypothetical protein